MNLNLERSSAKAKRNLLLFNKDLFAYGGDTGTISHLHLNSDGSIPTDDSPKVVHQLDDAVRALAFSPDGQRVAVGFEDGIIDIYEFSKEKVNQPNHPFQNLASSPSSSNDPANDADDLFTQNDDDDLLQFASTNATLSPSFRLPHRFESSIRSLQFCPSAETDRYYLAIATESSPGFAVVDVTTSSAFEKFLDEEATSVYKQNGVRNVAYSPDGNHIVTLGCDGFLCLWNVNVKGDKELDWELISKDKRKVIQKQDTGDFASVLDKSMAPVWCPSGDMIAIPGEIDLQLRRSATGESIEKWFAQERLVLKSMEKTQNKNEQIVAIVFDPRQEGYVITSSENGNVGLWKLRENMEDNEEPEGRFLGIITTTDSLCTDILWQKGEQESLLLALENGSMRSIEGRDCILPKALLETKATSVSLDNHEAEEGLEETLETEFDTQPPMDVPIVEKKRLKKASNDEEEEQDSDDELIFDQSQSKAVAKNLFVVDEADDVDGLDGGDYANNDLDKFGDVMESTQNEQNQNDNGDEVAEDVRNHPDPFGDNMDDDDYDDFDVSASDTRNKVAGLPEPQAPFAPSSTPIARRRILCWNKHGVITSRERQEIDGTYRTIDLSFTDSATNRPISFRDPYNFIIGTFGEEGGLFASDLMDDDDDDEILDDHLLNGMSDATRAIVKKSGRKKNGLKSERATGSNIYFHRFDTFGAMSDKDWHLALPEGERALGCATGSGWNAVVTNRRFLRLLSTAGNQGPVIWLKGNPVTLVGSGRFCAAIFHEGNPLMDGTQKLGYALYDGFTGRLIVEGSVSAMSPGSSLSWAGFSSDFSLCVMDEEGMLSMLVATKMDEAVATTYRWAPVLDTLGLKKSREDEFWPVSIQGGKLICVPLKGIKHPDPARRPVTASFSLRVPLAKGIGRTSILDEICVRANLALENKRFVQEIEVSANPGMEEDLEDEYSRACAKVDKATLTFFFKLMEDEKLENAYDLAQRLHLEKSLEIASTAADRVGQARLSDRIHDLRDMRFPLIEDPEEELQMYDNEPEYNNDTPKESTALYREVTATKFKRKEHEETLEDSDAESLDEPKPEPVRRRLNPFAKKHKESPPKKMMESPRPKKLTLSRMSTFTAESRQKSKLAKHFL